MFHAVLERNSYVFKPHSIATNSRIMDADQEIVLVAKETKVKIVELWHLRMGTLTRKTGLNFDQELWEYVLKENHVFVKLVFWPR